jgi:hypothetical protein
MTFLPGQPPAIEPDGSRKVKPSTAAPRATPVMIATPAGVSRPAISSLAGI